MSPRRYTRNLHCAEPSCKEWSFREFTTRRDEREDYARNKEWRCTRHSAPHKVVSLEDRVRHTTLVVVERRYGKFWADSTSPEGPGSGFVYGPGFQAWAKDFPPGTLLHLTAEIEAAVVAS